MFNGEYMRQLRLDMLEGNRRDDACTNCYAREDAGFTSARQGANKDFEQVIEVLKNSTAPDGYVDPKIVSWDVRYSNLCNLKCRSCGSMFSTTWAEEEGIENGKIYAIPEDVPDPMISQYDNVEKIYFAGGEPLIMPEHFQLLTKLIETGRSKNVTLIYNTNCTILDYKGNNLLDLWKNFKWVNIGASIDAMGPRIEYIRKGTRWSVIEKNLHKMFDYRNKQQNLGFYYSPTVSIFNVDHLPDMHRYFIDQGLANTQTLFLFNILLNPTYYSCKTLPIEYKLKTIDKIEKHIEWCVENHVLAEVIEKYKSVQQYLTDDNDYSKDFKNFVKETKSLDQRRNESFIEVFPEYKNLLEC
jgi:pyruvate-formate lyase-activating enzyme